MMHRAALSRFVCLALAALILSACVPGKQEAGPADLAAARIRPAERECRTEADGLAACFFRNSPVRLESRVIRIEGRSLDFRAIAEPLEFVDGAGSSWIAPRQTLTDGASIPDVFIPIVGAPRSPEFVNAAAVHDAYCGIGNEGGPVYHARSWQDTHRVFYDSLIVGGTPPLRAKVMFAAVWLGGPRWEKTDPTKNRAGSRLPAPVLQAGMREAKLYIERSDPTMPQLIGYLQWLEWQMNRRAYQMGSRRPSALPPSPPPTDPNSGK